MGSIDLDSKILGVSWQKEPSLDQSLWCGKRWLNHQVPPWTGPSYQVSKLDFMTTLDLGFHDLERDRGPGHSSKKPGRHGSVVQQVHQPSGSS